ncbi:NADPH:quinone reductase [Rhodopila globiformis]|uniref:Alcohol dehydrogenase n=1 Tax=Rhodopila globiformis TaxID=1071 RepID=A0A2S6MVZ9_RHOGL|nr:NADPH:quinone reductase [Rhodopila globiformis]PPQ26518.1 alcohol dehydrogenase [Rhodopila globiformis]
MRAVWYDRQGAANDVLMTGELPTPEPGPGQVRVRLEASGVNPSDTYRRRGAVPAEYPRVIPNSDGAGVIDKVGEGVPAERVGERVWLYNGQRNGRWMGTAAEYVALDANLVTALPDHVSFAAGATLGIPAMTAHGCVFAAGPVQGLRVLVTGGAGAVGHYAVQLAAWAGAEVIATVSSVAKAERARAGGAAHVINYRTEDVAARIAAITGGALVDHVVDVDLGGNLAATLASVRENGSIAYYATAGAVRPAVDLRALMMRNLTLRGFVLPTSPVAHRRRAQRDIAAFVGNPHRILSVAAEFPLYETAAAHIAVESGGKAGTVVVACAR